MVDCPNAEECKGDVGLGKQLLEHRLEVCTLEFRASHTEPLLATAGSAFELIWERVWQRRSSR